MLFRSVLSCLETNCEEKHWAWNTTGFRVFKHLNDLIVGSSKSNLRKTLIQWQTESLLKTRSLKTVEIQEIAESLRLNITRKHVKVKIINWRKISFRIWIADVQPIAVAWIQEIIPSEKKVPFFCNDRKLKVRFMAQRLPKSILLGVV